MATPTPTSTETPTSAATAPATPTCTATASPTATATATPANILANPGADTGDLSGWTILANGGNACSVRTYTFTNYGSGVRYVSWEDGRDDAEGWAGHYGAIPDGARLTVTP